MSDYGLMNGGKKVLEQALDLLAQADKKSKKTSCFFENLRKKQLVFFVKKAREMRIL